MALCSSQSLYFHWRSWCVWNCLLKHNIPHGNPDFPPRIWCFRKEVQSGTSFLGEEQVASPTVACSLPTSLQCYKNHTGKFRKSWKDEVADDGLMSHNSVGMKHHFTKPEYTNKHQRPVRSVVFWSGPVPLMSFSIFWVSVSQQTESMHWFLATHAYSRNF